jgi:hypothetical protein
MKYLFLGMIWLVSGQKGKGKGAPVPEPAVTHNNNTNSPDDEVTRKQWMETAVDQFFNDFEAGDVSRAGTLFAKGCPYISNGQLYQGMDMSDPATWRVIPHKTRAHREYSAKNRTELWARCIGTYDNGHQALEFTGFTFNDEGKINSMSKIEQKECPTAPGAVAPPPPSSTQNPQSQSRGTSSTVNFDDGPTDSTQTTTSSSPPATTTSSSSSSSSQSAPPTPDSTSAGKGKAKGKGKA